MFTTAYATQYTQNKHLFDELFSNFKKYYNGEDLDISVTIHTVRLSSKCSLFYTWPVPKLSNQLKAKCQSNADGERCHKIIRF